MDHSEEELERLASDLWEAEPVSLQEWQQLCDHTTDEVHVRNLSAQAKVGVDAWGRTKEQPLRISIVAKLTQTFDTAAQSDDVDESTINYGVLSKRVLEGLKQSTYEMENLNDLTHFVALFGGLYESDAVGAWTVEVCLPKALAVGSSIRFQNLVAKGDSSLTIANVLHLEDMTVSAIIGLNPHERYMKQPVVVNVWIGPSALGDDAERYVSVGQVIVKVCASALLDRLMQEYRALLLNAMGCRLSRSHRLRRSKRWPPKSHRT